MYFNIKHAFVLHVTRIKTGKHASLGLFKEHSFLDQFKLIFQDMMVCHSQTLNSQNDCKAVEKIKIQSE